MVREIASMIDLNANYAASALTSAGYRGTGEGGIEQNVHITAEFPNAVNHTEIEQAFDTLINRASQYVNRKI